LLRKLRVLLHGVTCRRPEADATPAAVGLPCEVVTLPGPAGELEAWCVPHPSPRGVVVLFHGYNSCKGTLLPEAKAFHKMQYACLLVDFRGSGGSAGDRTTIGYAEAEEVASAARYAGARWAGLPLVLYGRSMGSAASLRALGVLGVR